MTGVSPTPSGGRVFLRDIKPWAIVTDLDQLRGPAGGVVELSRSVLWAPGGRCVDLDEPGGRGLAYRAVLAEGTVEDLWCRSSTVTSSSCCGRSCCFRTGCVRCGRPGSPSCGPPLRSEC